MSVQALAWVFEHSESTGVIRLVLLSIANHVDPDGEGWVYIERVCAEANCSRDSYRRAIQWAEANHELEREVRAGGSRKIPDIFRPNHFVFVALTQDASVGGKVQGSVGGSLQGSVGGSLQGSDLEPSTEPSTEPSLEIHTQFAEFWARYPRKEGKPSAERAFKAALKRSTFEVVMAGLERWRAYWTRDRTERKLIKQPAGWLNDERYNDEPPAAKRTAALEHERGFIQRDLTGQSRTIDVRAERGPSG